MKLIKVNKARYRRHLNIVIAVCIVSLVIGSLAISQTLIALFPDQSGSHFHWNLSGVVASCVVIGLILNKYRHHNFMIEVIYVWELKKALNRINRRMRKLESAAHEGNVKALLALYYSYAGSSLLWQLDDNSIVMEELVAKQKELDNLALKFNITLNVDDYDDKILKEF